MRCRRDGRGLASVDAVARRCHVGGVLAVGGLAVTALTAVLLVVAVVAGAVAAGARSVTATRVAAGAIYLSLGVYLLMWAAP